MKKNPPQNPTLKTVIVSGDDKGGVGKTSNAIHLTDGLRALGYQVELVDADSANRTLSEAEPQAVQLESGSERELDSYLKGIATSLSDIHIIDMPGGNTGKALKKYFDKRGHEIFSRMGIRIVTALNLTSSDDSIKGAISWLDAFGSLSQFIILANHKDDQDDQFFTVTDLTNGEELLEMAEGRVIDIHKFDNRMFEHYQKLKALPSSYMEGGKAAQLLGLDLIDSSFWDQHLQKTIQSVLPHAQWLTGKAPLSPEWLQVTQSKETETSKFASAADKIRTALAAKFQK